MKIGSMERQEHGACMGVIVIRNSYSTATADQILLPYNVHTWDFLSIYLYVCVKKEWNT